MLYAALVVELLAEVVLHVLEDGLKLAEDIVDLFLGDVCALFLNLVEVLLCLVRDEDLELLEEVLLGVLFKLVETALIFEIVPAICEFAVDGKVLF